MAGPFFSTQLTNVNAQTVLQPGQGGGDSFIIPFDYTTAGGGGPAVGEIVYLCNIPEGFYVAGIHINTSGMGATTSADFGDDDATQRYAAGQTLVGTQNTFIALARTTGYLFRNDKLRQLRATAAASSAWAASTQIKGFVLGFRDA
jgi:hypothetical protein